MNLAFLKCPRLVSDHPYLVVVPLDGDKDLLEGLGFDDPVHELDTEPPAEGNHLHRSLGVLGKGGVEETEAETVLQVPDGVDEARVALPDDVVEGVLGLVGLEPVRRVKVPFGRGSLQLLEKHLEVSELPDDGLVQQEPDVLLVVEGLDPGDVALLGPFPVPRLARVDPFQNA